jgi:hypothetical protein
MSTKLTSEAQVNTMKAILEFFPDDSFTGAELKTKAGLTRVPTQTLETFVKNGLLEKVDGKYLLAVDEEDILESDVEWIRMNRKAFICTQDPSKSGVGDFFTINDIPAINQFYMSWKAMNEINIQYGVRRVNLPEFITEGLASILMNMPRTNNQTLTNIPGSADLVDIDTGDAIQIKGISTIDDRKGGPSSFGPDTVFDRLIVIHVRVDLNKAFFYELNAKEYTNWSANQNETFEDQKKNKRRPRKHLLPIIKEEGIAPFITYNFETGETE